MSIEFPCPECAQLVRTPDVSAGKKGKCPSCAAVFRIPGGNEQPSPAPQSQPSPPPARPATKPAAPSSPGPQSTATDDAPIEFFCSSCGQQVRTPRSAGGKKGKCPHCGDVMMIPLPKAKLTVSTPPAPAAAASKGPASKPAPVKQPPAKQTPAELHADMFPPSHPASAKADLAGAKPKPAAGPPADKAPTAKAPAPNQSTTGKPATTNPTANKASPANQPAAKPAAAGPTPAKPAAPKPAPGKPAPLIDDLGLASLDEPVSKAPPKKPSLSGESSVRGVQPLAPLQPLEPLNAPLASPIGLDPLTDLTPLGPAPLGGPGDPFAAGGVVGGIPVPYGAPGLAPLAGPIGVTPFGSPVGPAPFGAVPYGAPGYGVPPANAFQPSPYQAPAPYGAPVMQPAGSGDLALMLPAIFQLIAIAPFIVLVLISLANGTRAALTKMSIAPYAPAVETERLTTAIIIDVVAILITVIILILHGMIVYGSIGMIRRRGLGNALAAAWMSVIPCISPLGLPFGIWSLVVLSNHQVKRSFR